MNLLEHPIHIYMRDRDGWISTSEGSLISTARRTARIWMLLQHPHAYGHLYSYRKSLWNTPLRLLYWLHGSSSVSVRIRELNVRASLRCIYRWLSDDTAGTADFSQRIYKDIILQRIIYVICFYNLNIYFTVEEKLILLLFSNNFSFLLIINQEKKLYS